MQGLMQTDRALANLPRRADIATDRRSDLVFIDHQRHVAEFQSGIGSERPARQYDERNRLARQALICIAKVKARVILTRIWIQFRSAESSGFGCRTISIDRHLRTPENCSIRKCEHGLASTRIVCALWRLIESIKLCLIIYCCIGSSVERYVLT